MNNTKFASANFDVGVAISHPQTDKKDKKNYVGADWGPVRP